MQGGVQNTDVTMLCLILFTGTSIPIDSVMCPRSSISGRNMCLNYSYCISLVLTHLLTYYSIRTIKSMLLFAILLEVVLTPNSPRLRSYGFGGFILFCLLTTGCIHYAHLSSEHQQ